MAVPNAEEEPAHPPAGSVWEVQLLGALQARIGKLVITRFGGTHAELLFARLLLQPGHEHSRDRLAEWMWPRIGDRKGRRVADELQIRRSRLRRALCRLTEALSPPGRNVAEPFHATQRTLQLHAAAFQCDATAFERQAKSGNAGQARALYRGPLLPGLDDAWIEDQRAYFETLHDDLPASALIPARPAEPVARPLLAYARAFFGRQQETAQLLAALAGKQRWVVVTGPAGCGKSRLCITVARLVDSADVAAWVRLEDCSDSSQLADRVRDGLGLPIDDAAPQRTLPAALQGSAWAQITAYLRGRRSLLVMDNFEQLVGLAAEAAVGALLRQLPQLQILMSSRRAPQSARAVVVQLGPLPLPLPEVGVNLAAAAANPAVALFVDRARAASVGFALNRRNLSGVIDLVRTLDGLPLALEIAATRVKGTATSALDAVPASVRATGTPHKIGASLRKSLAAAERQRGRAAPGGRYPSLDAALTCSWDLLGAAERDTLAALTVFRGGWTARQAQAVAGSAGVAGLAGASDVDGVDQAVDVADVADAQRLLNALLHDSLVYVEADAQPRPRFWMLNSIREFAATRLSPAQATAAARRHRDVFAAIAAAVVGGDQALDLADLPNMLAAINGAVDGGAAETAASIALALQPHWTAAGASGEALAALRRTVSALPPSSTPWPALATLLAALLVASGRSQEAAALARLAVTAAGADKPRLAEALLAEGNVCWLSVRDGAATLAAAETALRLATDCALPALQARALLLMGAANCSWPERVQLAKRQFADAQRLFQKLRDRRGELRALSGRSACLVAEARYTSAIRLSRVGERLAASLQDVNAVLQFCSRLSTAWEGLGQHAKALDVCRRHLVLARSHGMTYHLAYGYWNQCEPRAQLGQLESATLLMAFSAQFWVSRFGPLDAADSSQVEALVQRARQALGDARCDALLKKGRTLGEDEAFELATAPIPSASLGHRKKDGKGTRVANLQARSQ